MDQGQHIAISSVMRRFQAMLAPMHVNHSKPDNIQNGNDIYNREPRSNPDNRPPRDLRLLVKQLFQPQLRLTIREQDCAFITAFPLQSIEIVGKSEFILCLCINAIS
jgi:hypothetical protein